MKKKLTPNIITELEKQSQKRKILNLKVGDESYSVKIKYGLSSKEKEQFLQDISTMTLENTGYPEIAFFTIALVENLTDIDLGEDLETKMKMIIVLMDSGHLEEIAEAFPKKLVKDLEDYLEISAELLPSITKQLIFEQYQEGREQQKVKGEEEDG